MSADSIAILVCGGRDYADRAFLCQYLDELRAERPIKQLIHGAARGADSLAAQWAKSRGVPTRAFPADWNRYGKSAGFRRNERMLQEGRPDLVIAFPGGAGAAHMVKVAAKANTPVREAVPDAWPAKPPRPQRRQPGSRTIRKATKPGEARRPPADTGEMPS